MISENRRSAKTKEWFSCRDILWWLVFTGFAIEFILQANLGIAVVAMVLPKPVAAAVSQCIKEVQITSNSSNLWVNASNSPSPLPLEYLSWTEYEQGLALGSYYFLNWVTQIPGGLLARRYGTKFVLGWANLSTALIGFLLPFSARYDLYAFVFLRLIQGVFSGCIWPSMHHMTAKWIPRNERSKFISAYSGHFVGLAINYPLCALIINWFGWETVFYVTSLLGVFWSLAWYYLAYNTPEVHPRILETEKTHILDNRDYYVENSTQKVPWKAVLISPYVWITAITQFGGGIAGIITMSESPSYFHHIHGWNISATGVLSSAPHLMAALSAYLFSKFADWLLKTNKMSITNVRKFAIFLCNGLQGLTAIGLAFSGCHPILAIVFMIAGATAGGSFVAGSIACYIDLSPNYGSILLGIGNVFLSSGGFIAPVIVGILTNNNQTVEQWRLVFLIVAVTLFSTGTLFLFFGTADVQPWNDQDQYRSEDDERLKPRSNADIINDCRQVGTEWKNNTSVQRQQKIV